MCDKLECGCKENAQARIDKLVLVRTTQARNGTNRNMGTSSWTSNGRTVERRQAGVQDAKINTEKPYILTHGNIYTAAPNASAAQKGCSAKFLW